VFYGAICTEILVTERVQNILNMNFSVFVVVILLLLLLLLLCCYV